VANSATSASDYLGGGIFCYCAGAFAPGAPLPSFDKKGKPTMDGGQVCNAKSLGKKAGRTVATACINRMFTYNWMCNCSKRTCLVRGDFVCSFGSAYGKKRDYHWVSTGTYTIVKSCP